MMIRCDNEAKSLGVQRVLYVPTRPRSVRKRMQGKQRGLFISSLRFSPEELEEKIAKLKYSRDYSLLFEDMDDNTQFSRRLTADNLVSLHSRSFDIKGSPAPSIKKRWLA
ncbi:unnamed protein product [Ilex paraguariensis]|uniref:Uncharacterized protein n=1 Tax=Ilex paraguariensis TaxID=185542 RepID=A0ABC8QRA5_9AQUA